MGEKKKRKNERMCFLHILVRVLIGWVLYQPVVHNNINTRHLEVYNMLFMKITSIYLRVDRSCVTGTRL